MHMTGKFKRILILIWGHLICFSAVYFTHCYSCWLRSSYSNGDSIFWFFRYASSFRFSGDYVDEREVDTLGRRKTRIVAIDALCSPGMRQYRANFLLRSVNIGLCGCCFYGCKITVIYRLWEYTNKIYNLEFIMFDV